MDLFKAITVLVLSTLLFTACGSKKEAAAVTSNYTPSLELALDLSGNTATIHFQTDLHISAEKYGKPRTEGEGHIHFFLDDGEKRVITDNTTVLKDLAAGKHNIKVSLHNNDHTPYNVSKSIDFEVK